MTQNRKIQYLAAFAVSLATMSNSTAYFWTAPMLPKFYNNETSFKLTPGELSWVVASISPGIITGSLLTSSISDRFGRRATLLCSAAPYIVGTISILCASEEVWLIYIGRFLWGCASGMITTVTSVYLSEIADKEIRGTLTAGTRFMFSFGALLVLAIGSFVSYQVLSLLLIALPLCYFVACWRIPETPYFLLKVGRVDDARKELLSLSGSKDEKAIDEKLSLMRSEVRTEMLRSSTAYELLTGKQYRKAIIVTSGLRLTQLMAGSIPIQQYLGRIVQESNSGMKISTALIIFGVVRFAVGLIAPVIVDKVGRRPLLIYTYLGSASMLSIIGTYFFQQRIIGIDEESSNPFRFVVFSGIICSIVISSLGFDTLVFVIPSEIFPINVRSVSMTVLNIYTAVITFVAVKGYQTMVDWVDLYGVFWFYTTMAVSGAVFTYFVVPETKGKSLREIQIEFQGNIYDEADESLKRVDVPNDDGYENTELKEMVHKNGNT